MKFKNFSSAKEMFESAYQFLVEQFREDYGRMCKEESQHYADEDRQDVLDKLSDYQAAEPLFHDAAKYRELIEQLARLDTQEDFESRGDVMENDDAVETLDRMIEQARDILPRKVWDPVDSAGKCI